MKNLSKKLRGIAANMVVAETFRLKDWITKEEFKDTLNSAIDRLFQLSEEVESESSKDIQPSRGGGYKV